METTKTPSLTGMRWEKEGLNQSGLLSWGGGGVSRQGQHPLFAAFPGRAARERKREASKIPEWIDRCYVIGAASSTPQEARSQRKRQASGRGHRASAPPPRSR